MDSHGALISLLESFWTQIAALIALIVWLVRGEANTKANTNEIRRLWRQRAEDMASQREAREHTNEMLDEVRADIKTLLARRD